MQGQLRNGNANGIFGQASPLAGSMASQVFPSWLSHLLLPARQAHHSFPLPTLATTTTNPPTGNINADNPLLTILTNILAPSPNSPASSPSGSSKSPSLSQPHLSTLHHHHRQQHPTSKTTRSSPP
ncbi:hypothetical protein M407DRAFT_30906 [Tulasnella calospora MUT 4182]|uniref:Uncharacterized protein n=1 Tax=Tulasnella calospora MUT 4182 TaxID=1051891 RepID=A0A0C3Q7E8_9AGAM|nr:hypothetical protein M407DRAFT_30906 [Tulasnella calospora MUT 4182]